jgi:phospholipid/cholesterol/gamma-HCH transport system substrate-binding protein
MNRNRSDFAVGLTVIAALGVFFFSALELGTCSLLQPSGLRVITRFDDAGGVTPRAEVRVAGVRVGAVERVELEDGRARMTLRIDDRGQEIPIDSTVVIRSHGLLGERVVELVRGDSDRIVQDGDTLMRTQEAPNLDAMLDSLATVAIDLREVTRSVRLVLGGAEGEEALAEVVANIRIVAGEVRSFIEDNQDQLSRVVNNFDDASGNLSGFSEDLAGIAADNDQTVRELLVNFAGAAERLQQTADELAKVSARVEAGEGTLGRLLKDDELYTKVDSSVTELNRTLEEVRRAAEEAQEQLPVTVLGSVVGSLF